MIKQIAIFSILIFFMVAVPIVTVAQSNWKAPPSADSLQNPLENSKTVLSAGKTMYSQLCRVCHGNTGRGDGPTAAALNPKPAKLTSEAVQSQNDGAIFWKINHGNPPMPGFQSRLSEKQTWALVSYIRSLNNQTKTKK